MGPLIPALVGASVVVDIMLTLYNSWREHPDVKMAEHLRALQVEKATRKSREMGQEEKIRGRHAELRTQRLQDLMEMKQGLDEGWISPAELGVSGGGMSTANDMPMVSAMAARLGMDPQDLAARFDPGQSNMYVPMSRRGAVPRGSARQLALKKAPIEMTVGPAQLNPMTGFGS